MLRLSLFAWLLLALWPGDSRADERRIALVVGVSNYKHAPRLPNTHNDARGVAEALGRLGFEVEQLLDPDRATLETGVRNLRQRARGADASLFYYAGHALELGGRNWLLPVGADLQTDRDLRFEGLDLDSILEQMEGASRVSLVFLDACRENPFRMKIAGGSREVSTRGLARVASGSGTFVAFSTAPGTVAQDGTGANSPFTAALLKRIETAGLELRRMLSQVRTDVREATDGRQVPWENSALEGDFFFRPPPGAATTVVVPPPAPPPAPADREVVFWNSISGSRDPADFRAYLAQFPQGIFAELARNRLAQMQAALAPPVMPNSPPPAAPATPPPSAAAPPSPDTPPSPLREALLTRLAAALPEQSAQARDDLARNYERIVGHRALAVLPGTTKTWRVSDRGLGENIDEKALEACQFQHLSPCALIAVGDKVQPAPADGRWIRRDMPRVRHEGRFDPERIPALRTDVLIRADVKGYARLAGPKAVAYHPWGRVFIASATPSQRAAEEQALAACNGDPGRKGADGPCYLYAVGNKVILPQRLTTARPPAGTVGQAISMIVSDRNLSANYAADTNHKALAIEPESGRAFRWGGVGSAEQAERVALEGCQISFALPCVLIASNDEVRAPDPLGAQRQDMARVRYSGAYQADKVPLLWVQALPEVNAYASRKGHKAMAMRAILPALFVARGEKSAAEAERKALAMCNAHRETPYPCFLYAVNNTVVLAQRRTEPSR
jgi:uncharacterized caspase-like protein